MLPTFSPFVLFSPKLLPIDFVLGHHVNSNLTPSNAGPSNPGIRTSIRGLSLNLPLTAKRSGG